VAQPLMHDPVDVGLAGGGNLPDDQVLADGTRGRGFPRGSATEVGARRRRDRGVPTLEESGRRPMCRFVRWIRLTVVWCRVGVDPARGRRSQTSSGPLFPEEAHYGLEPIEPLTTDRTPVEMRPQLFRYRFPGGHRQQLRIFQTRQTRRHG
jgi:hypothetical protein